MWPLMGYYRCFGFLSKYEFTLARGNAVGVFECAFCRCTRGISFRGGTPVQARLAAEDAIKEHCATEHFSAASSTVSSLRQYVYEVEAACRGGGRHQDHPPQQHLGLLEHDRIDKLHRRVGIRWPGVQFDVIAGDVMMGAGETCPHAELEGEPLRGRPDVVLANSRVDMVLVVERKCRRSVGATPVDGWIDNRVQTWAYMWMKPWQHAREVHGLLEYWPLGSEADEPAHSVWLSREDQALHDQGIQWLQRFGGKWRGPRKAGPA